MVETNSVIEKSNLKILDPDYPNMRRKTEVKNSNFILC